MTTPQITIITIISLLTLVAFIYSLWTENREHKNSMSFLIIFMFTIMGLIAVLSTKEMMVLRENKTKCPQYEKVENVYKLKQ